MEIPSPERSARDCQRFVAAVVAAVIFHGLIAAGWSVLPFDRPEEGTSVEETEAPALSVQFVDPPPSAPPEPEPDVDAEAITPPTAQPEFQPPVETDLSAEQVITTDDVTESKSPPVEKDGPPPPPRTTMPPPPKPAPAPAPSPKKALKAPPRKTTITTQPALRNTATSTAPPAAASSARPTAPAYWSNPKPPYPAEAKRDGIEGITYLKVEVLASGEVGSVRVLTSSGSRLLDDSAATTVKSHWRFHPAKRGGSPVGATVTVPIRFELR